MLLPLGYLGYRALAADLSTLRELVFRLHHLHLLFSSLGLAATVFGTTTLLGLPLAFLAARTSFRPKRLLMLLGVLPLAIPGYLGAYALLAASGPGGTLTQVLPWVWPRPSGFWGALGILSLFTFPYLFLNFLVALRSQDPRLEEAAHNLGQRPRAVFWRITWPQLRPAWLSGGLLVVLHVLGDFSVVSLMRYPSFSAAIYQQYTAAYDRVYSAWLALLLLLVTGLLLWLEARWLRRLLLVHSAQSGSRPASLWPLGRWAWPVWGLVLAVGTGSLLIPLGTIGYWWVQGRSLTVPGDLWRALHTVLVSGALAAGLTTLLAFPLAYIGSRYPGAWAAWTERLAYLGYATPPLALALALIFFSLRVLPAWYQSWPLLLLAYALHFSAEVLGPLRSSFNRATVRLEEAARLLGASHAGALRRVTLPLIRPGLWTSAAFVFLGVIKELPLTLLLAPIGVETLARQVWTSTEEAQYAAAAPAALALVGCGLGLSLLILRRTD